MFIVQFNGEEWQQKSNVRFIDKFSLLAVFFPAILLVVKVRINGTKNIAKITKSMKMVSAAKLRGDQQRLAAANPFSVISRLLYVIKFNCICLIYLRDGLLP